MKYLNNFLRGAKKILKNPITYLAIASMPLFYCEPEEVEPVKPSKQTENANKPSNSNTPENTENENQNSSPQNYVLNQTTINNLSLASETKIYFATSPAELSDLKEGDFLISDITDKTPEGLLKKVISFSSDKREINVSQAYPPEVVENGLLNKTYTLTSSDLKSSSLLEGIKISSAKGFDFAYSIDKIFYDSDGNPLTTDNQGRITGEISFNDSWNVNLEIENHKVKYFSFINNLEQSSSLTVDASFSKNIAEKETVLFEIPFNPITIGYIGVVPVIIVPSMQIVEGHVGEFNLSAFFEMNQMLNFESGISYDGTLSSNKWAPIKYFSNKINCIDFNLEGESYFGIYAGPVIRADFWGLGGVFAQWGLFGKASSSLENKVLNAKLSGGSVLKAGIGPKVLSELIPSYDVVLFNDEKILFEKEIEIGEPSQKDLDSIVIQPGPFEGKDASVMHVIYSNGAESFTGKGNDSVILVSYQDAPFVERRALIQFPLDTVPDDLDIVSAKFGFYGASTNNYVNVNPKINLYKLESGWNESNISWDTKPAGSFFSGNYFSNSGLRKWHDFEITSLVKDWIKNNLNHGLEISTNNESDVRINSSDHEDAEKRPKLVIYY